MQDRRQFTIALRSIVLGDDPSVSRAAEKLRIGRPALSAVLNGRAALSVDLACRIEDRFEYSAVALLTMQAEAQVSEYRRSVGSVILPVLTSESLELVFGRLRSGAGVSE